jgi:hypothetical protein
MGGRAIGGRKRRRMIGGGGFVLDLGFHCISKMKATQMTRIAASACRLHSRLGPFVIDLTGQAPGNKKSNQSNGWGEKWDREFTVSLPSNERRAHAARG